MANTDMKKSHIFETVKSSGTVYVTLDSQLVYWHRFQQHIKVHVLYDKDHTTVLPDDAAQSFHISSSEHDSRGRFDSSELTNASHSDDVRLYDLAEAVSSFTQSDREGMYSHGSVDDSHKNYSETEKSDNENTRNSTETNIYIPVQEDVHEDETFCTADSKNVCDSETGQVEMLQQATASNEAACDYEQSKCNIQNNVRKQIRKSERLSKKAVKVNKRSNSSVKYEVRDRDKRILKKNKTKTQQRKSESSVEALNVCLLKRRLESSIECDVQEIENNRKPTKIKADKGEDAHIHKAPKVRKLEQEKDVRCEYCLKAFKSQQEYFDHRKGDRASFKCRICNKSVPFKAHLMVHMRKHNNATQEFPTSTVSKGGQYPLSSNSSDRKECKIRCEVCGLAVSNIPILKTHTMIHTGEFAYKCCVCDEKTRSIAKHNNHLSTHLKSGKVQCKICSIFFDSRSDLSKHQLTHEFRCSICDQVFPNKTCRVFHYKMAHKEDIIRCPVCGKMFSSEDELAPHLKYHRNRAKTQCTTCGLFVTRLDNHMLSHVQRPEDGRMFVCDQCPKQFKQKLSFQRHLRIHSEEKPYACMECPKRFARSGGLRRHMITHTQEKPFVCDICGKACSQMGNLRIHMQIHKDSSPAQCQVCGENFSYKNAMQEHMRSAHYVDASSLDPTTAPNSYYT